MNISSTPGGPMRKAEGEVFPYNPDPRLSADLPAILIFLASMPYEIHWRIQTQIQNLDVRSSFHTKTWSFETFVRFSCWGDLRTNTPSWVLNLINLGRLQIFIRARKLYYLISYATRPRCDFAALWWEEMVNPRTLRYQRVDFFRRD